VRPPISLKTVRLSKGDNKADDSKVCALEAAAWLAGEPHSDRPQCVCPLIAAFVRSFNDELTYHPRQKLVAYLPRMIQSRGTYHDEAARARVGWSWLLRDHAPIWLEDTGLDSEWLELNGWAIAEERLSIEEWPDWHRLRNAKLDVGKLRLQDAHDRRVALLLGDGMRSALNESAWFSVYSGINLYSAELSRVLSTFGQNLAAAHFPRLFDDAAKQGGDVRDWAYKQFQARQKRTHQAAFRLLGILLETKA
jgi:hypothetical protein